MRLVSLALGFLSAVILSAGAADPVAAQSAAFAFYPADAIVTEAASRPFSWPEGGTVVAAASSAACAYVPADGVVATADSVPFSFDLVQEVTAGGVTWSFVLMGGAVTVVGVRGMSAGECVIPASLGGYPVKAIGRAAFSGCSDLVSVIVPQGVTNVGDAAFADCASLKSVVLTEFVTGIGAGAFRGCVNLVSVNLPEGLDAIRPQTFAGCEALEQIEIPESVRQLGEEAFFGCARLRILDFPSALSQIGGRAFAGCRSLNRLSFPASVVEIGQDAFSDCTGLTSATFAGQPPVGIRESGLVKDGIMLHGPADVLIEPPDGSVFGLDVHVTLSTTWPNGIVRYTLDGSEPTSDSPADSAFSLHAKTIVRAATFVDGLRWGEIAKATYGVGKIATPEIGSEGGDVFSHNGKIVTISCATRDVEIRYTLNGSEPTDDSVLYSGPFEISRTTTVRAKAFSHPDYVDSDVAERRFVREWIGLARPSISPEGGLFAAEKQHVTISCESEGATIYYTLDGTLPSAVNGFRYTGPFDLYRSATVTAVATKYDWMDSEVASASFKRENELGEAMNCFGYLVDTGAAAPWTVDAKVSHDGVSSARSAALENGASRVQLTVKGAGRLSFWWKSSCEEPYGDDYYDFGVFRLDNVTNALIAGQTEWRRVVADVPQGGKHTFVWEYVKDEVARSGDDCIWLDQVVWTPADGSGKTLTSKVPVPYSWLEEYGFGDEIDFESAVNLKTGKRTGFGRELTVWEDYVAGTNPTNVNSVFTAIIDLSGGKPSISWHPNLNEGRIEPARIYKVLGAKSLDGEWLEVDGNEEDFNFFTVTVEMPDELSRP